MASPELTGGAGFTFEDACAAVYLAALLAEETAPGLPDKIVVRVDVQQAPAGRPLDDLIVTARALDGSEAKLDFQVKRGLTPSDAASNDDFREIVDRAWKTITAPEFKADLDRVGAITGQISADNKRALETICSWARATATSAAFLRHFDEGVANQAHRAIRDAVQALLGEIDPALGGDAPYRFFRHFVLITFDFPHEGEITAPTQIALLRSVLADNDKERAPDLWHRLQRIARLASGHGAVLDRATLLMQLQQVFRFSGSRSLRSDLALIAESSARAIAEIDNRIAGLSVPRSSIAARLQTALGHYRYAQIVGLPGTGKSVVLRAYAQEQAAYGPTFVLKADRLQGASWATYATALGLQNRLLKPLLVEIAAVGVPILFIDGLDRIEINNRGVVNDILNLLATDPDLQSWRVVATVRDNGVEPLRTWLSPDWARNPSAVVEILPFDDDEASQIVKERPGLRSLLFGGESLRELARRPFFLSALSALPGNQAISSEIDLVNAWWARGGYNAPPERAGHRQRALIALARGGAMTMGRRVQVAEIDPTSITELKIDGLIRDVQPGHTVAFTHDIYFEWAFLHLLIGAGTDWIAALRGVGEPPVLGRVVELLSQYVFPTQAEWAAALAAIEASDLRPQWRRAWLLGPFYLSDFATFAADYTALMLQPGSQRLRKIVVWFQAEKTRANPQVLDGTIGNAETLRERVRLADIVAWPSDVTLWARFLDWLLSLDTAIPYEDIADVVSAMEVWQSLWGGRRNWVSQRILALAVRWLYDLEDRLHSEEFSYDHGPWTISSEAMAEIETNLRAIFLRASRAYPETVKPYFERLLGRERLRSVAFDQVIGHSLGLVTNFAPELRVLTRTEVCEDLPEVVEAREREPHRMTFHSFGTFDWHRLSISSEPRTFDPPSPLQEPFLALFANDPDEARGLTCDLANHAITAWRQLHRLDPMRPGTPIPLSLNFPWGVQTFWGDGQVYQWFRGAGAPGPVECALMSLEKWAFDELENGRDFDSVLRDVLDGHDCVAVLGIAVALAITAQTVTPGLLPIVTSQRVWRWDIKRMVQDRSLPPNLIGFSMRGLDGDHFEAVKAGNARPCRLDEVRTVAMLFVLSGDEALSGVACTAITEFPDNLPYDIEEHRNNATHTAELRRTAEIWAEIAKQENYRLYQASQGDGVVIRMENPTAKDPDVVAINERQQRHNDHWVLLNWALKTFENNAVQPSFSITDAVVRAKALDDSKLFSEPDQKEILEDLRRNAVAGVAAAALTFGEAEVVNDGWAQSVIARAIHTVEPPGQYYTPSAILPYHPCIFATRGLAALIKAGGGRAKEKEALLSLAAHPYEQISEAALAEAMGCWDIDARLGWAALNLGVALSIGKWNPERVSAYGYGNASNSDYVAKVVAATIKQLVAKKPSTKLPEIPPPWIKMPDTGRGDRYRSSEQGFTMGEEFLRWDYLPRILRHIPISRVIADPDRAPAFLEFCQSLVKWTIDRISPPWLADEQSRKGKRQRQENYDAEVLEWRSALYKFLAKVALQIDADTAAAMFLLPAFALKDKLALSLIEPFADWISRAGVFDPFHIAPQALPLLEKCADRALAAKEWQRAARDDGRIFERDLPALMRIFLFVQVKNAPGATRFANGDWHEVGLVLPIIDRIVRGVGQVPTVMAAFLSLCERSLDYYPGENFVDQVAAVLGKQEGVPPGWRGTTMAGRVAALIYEFAERQTSLSLDLAQRMLRVLDSLVDMGDRRSAALQTSELFREVRVKNGQKG
jgi:hypothetical protein